MKIYMNLTNLMNVKFTTGIQRVVIEVAVRLIRNNISVVLFQYNDMRKICQKLDNHKFIDFYHNGEGRKEDIVRGEDTFDFKDIEPWAIYYDIDGVWNNCLSNLFIYKQLKIAGTKIVVFIHDIVPVTYPQFGADATVFYFMRYFAASLAYADQILVSTNAIKNDIESVVSQLGMSPIPIQITGLAADFKKEEKNEKVNAKAVKTVKNLGDYILCVGTIEPRKNQKLVLDAFDKEFAELGLGLVFVGRVGWNSEELVDRIKTHPKRGKTFFFVDDANDATLNYYYQNAYALAFPSFYEGFGLPIVEALQMQVPVISSDVNVLKEVGGDCAVYFESNNVDSFLDVLRNYRQNPGEYDAMREHITEYSLLTWDDVVRNMLHSFHLLEKGCEATTLIQTDQVFMLTARPSAVKNALGYIDTLIPFIHEVLIVCPGRIVEPVRNEYKGRLNLVFVTDEELLDGSALPQDHVKRNFCLRALAMSRPEMKDYFIMYDDDYRPLFPIQEEVFVTEGRINAFYCHEMATWVGDVKEQTSYDIGVHTTKDILNEWKCPTLLYASHMPQMMSKKIWIEIIRKLPDIFDAGCEEWSMFYNYGIKHYPERFNRVPFKTLCWPGYPSDWKVTVEPEEYLFENFYEEYYNEGGMFDGFSKEYTDNYLAENVKKIAIRTGLKREYDQAYAAMKTYHTYYTASRKYEPSLSIIRDNEGTFLLLPEYLMLPLSHNRDYTALAVPLEISWVSCFLENKMPNITLSCGILDLCKNAIFWQDEYNLIFHDNKATFKVFTPNYGGQFSFFVKVMVSGNSLEKSTPLYLV